jgi:FtsZ-interacting cell division protein ZipA
MLTTILLIIILLLLIAIVAMIVTGWPGREREEIEKTGNALRREMAEHRAESIQLLHAIRIEVEDSVRESIEREMAGFGSKGGRSRGSRSSGSSKGISKPRAQQAGLVAASDELPSMVEEDGADYGFDVSVIEARQLPLFPESPEPARADAPSAAVAAAPSVPQVAVDDDVPPPEVIRIGYMFDDIPDVE